jgi:class 3 adenylate cyclase
MQQVSDWLEKLGLGQYAERFAENGISISALPHLSDQDLKDIGVLLGHRRIMLAALGELVPGATTAERSAVVAPLPQDTAERRQVTVMFSDLVGSTALSARMDPEDLREIISAYQKCVAETVGRFGGFVAKYMGDGVLVYFGYPQHMSTRGAGGTGGAGVDPSGWPLEVQCSTANPRRHCHRVGRDWRSNWNGFGPGAAGGR